MKGEPILTSKPPGSEMMRLRPAGKVQLWLLLAKTELLESLGLSRRSPLRGEWGGKKRKQTNMKLTIHEFADRLSAVASVRFTQPLPSGWFGDGSPLATEAT